VQLIPESKPKNAAGFVPRKTIISAFETGGSLQSRYDTRSVVSRLA